MKIGYQFLSVTIGSIAALSLMGLVVSSIFAAKSYSEHDFVALTGFATWAGALGAVFSGCAIFLGFLLTAQEQRLSREATRVQEAQKQLLRFRTDPMLSFFMQLIDWAMQGTEYSSSRRN